MVADDLQRRPLDECFRHLIPVEEAGITWSEGTIPLHVRAYLCNDEPPRPFVTSARCIVCRGEEVLVVENDDERYILPGGRLEPGESPADGVRREVMEETGVELGPLRRLGVLHFHHLGPRPKGYAYPFPDFLQIVYGADVVAHRPDERIFDPYATRSYFLPRSDVDELSLGPGQHVFLQAYRPHRPST